jgi:signal transduction histidine kinase
MSFTIDDLCHTLYVSASFPKETFIDRAVNTLKAFYSADIVSWNAVLLDSPKAIVTQAISLPAKRSAPIQMVESLEQSPYLLAVESSPHKYLTEAQAAQLSRRRQAMYRETKLASVLPLFVGIPYSKTIHNAPIAIIEICTNSPLTITNDDRELIERYLAKTYFLSLRATLSDAATSTSHLLTLFDLTTFLNDLSYHIQRLLACEGVTIFLPRGNQLSVGGTTGIEWIVSVGESESYARGEGITGLVWENGTPLCTIDSLHQANSSAKSTESVPHGSRHSCIWMPVLSGRKKVIAVIRARNKVATDSCVPAFDGTDIDLLNCIVKGSLAHLELLISEDQEKRKLALVSHEVKNALQCIQGALTALNRESRTVVRHSETIKLASSRFSLMSIVLQNSDRFRQWPRPITLKKRLTHLANDVVRPSLQDLYSLLVVQKASADAIKISASVISAPILKLDPRAARLAVTNLLHNAIIYRDHTRPFVRCIAELECIDDGSYLHFIIRDFGIGFPIGDPAAFFEPNQRGPNAYRSDVSGKGLGLWVANRIAEAHGGSLRVLSMRDPTEVELRFPC